ncbi:uncharacterized protein LOC115624074 isoform X1 [Scaptodrosophila lebanonensis]|uniref:Galectin n=1 Tax=Drosophila lebanonensis TaxID=7225 RepID=A0A6J2THK9_DROLE|nr:uncharacterized protein LOC115624074 isoform X1 [Scaptodrosophila lebanonensis]XP_030374522.1 uncharacterized protein LOC115624074 isoform X1 [Scaptodrosophila lebanonensis]
MPDVQFFAVLPQQNRQVSKIRLHGTLDPNAEQFSVNFVNDRTCIAQQNIAYHFKEIVSTYPQVLIEDYKENGEWQDYQEKELSAFDGRSELASINHKKHKNQTQSFNADDAPPFSSTATAFALEFSLNYETNQIHAYNIQDDGVNILSSYDVQVPLQHIQALQVWGNVDKVTELTLLYE